jgi:hypothetical protein
MERKLREKIIGIEECDLKNERKRNGKYRKECCDCTLNVIYRVRNP